MTFRRDRGGLLDSSAVRRVLDREETFEKYRSQRQKIADEEPYLDRNMQHWLDQEATGIREKFPHLRKEEIDWMLYLLERYFVRGYMCKEEALNSDLQNSLGCEEEDKP